MRFSLAVRGAIATIAFDDSGMNLLSSTALRELGACVKRLPAAAVLVFRSAQPRLFAAGADMNEMVKFTAEDAYAFSKLGQDVFSAIEQLPMKKIALVDGDCFGGALDLILAFDLRFATPRSRFAHPGAKLGIVTGFGGTTRWRKVVTPPVARQLFLANRTFSAAEALEAGLVDRVGEEHEGEIGRIADLRD
jgi:enoyl-CoA hydratase